MGIFGWGSDEAEKASDEAARQVKDMAQGGALEQARSTKPQDGLTAAATSLVEKLLDVGIDGKGPFDSAEQVAEAALAEAGRDAEKAIALVRRSHRRVGAVGGFVTGLGGFFTMPVSLPANVLEFYLVSTRMTAAIAKLRGYDINQPEIRSAILLTLAGADSDDLLKKAGLSTTGGKLAALATDRLPPPALMVLNKAVGFQVLGRIGKSTFARLGRMLPVFGGLVGGGFDAYLLGRIAKQASKEFPAVSPFRG